MPTETTDFIAGLDQSRPQGSESLSEADDHLRLIKKSITSTFVGSDGNFYDKPVTAGPDDLNAIPTRWGDTVDRTTNQTVGGVKDFTDNIKARSGVVDGNDKNLIERSGGDVYVASEDGAVGLVSQDDKSVYAVWDSGNQTSRVLTEANVIELMVDVFYPVGITISGGPDPADRLPGTQWERLEGVVLIGAGTHTDADGKTSSFTLDQEEGGYEHTLWVAELPSHMHRVGYATSAVGSGGFACPYPEDFAGNTTKDGEYVGGDEAHNNIQPSLPVMMWRRIS